MPPLRRSATLTAALLLGAAVLTGCSSTVSLQPATDANNPLCADVSVRLPETVGDAERRWTDAQATGAWGDEPAVILTCGVTPPGPTEAKCITLGGVDWIVDETDAPRYRVTTYGRTPAVQVYVDNKIVSPNEALERLGTVIGAVLPAESKCTSTETLLP